jgi:hypothetical protein
MTWFGRCRSALAAICALCVFVACSGGPGPPESSPSGQPSVDSMDPVSGVPDRGGFPAVIAIDVGGPGLCSGALVAPDVVLTARHCVSVTTVEVKCPASGHRALALRSPPSLRVLVGEDLVSAEERRGRDIVVPPGAGLCEQDLALLLLDRPVDGVQPLSVRPTGIARGDHVRTVGFGWALAGGRSATRLLRDHVLVIDTTSTDLRVAEAACQGGCGGPALDEATGEIVGVVSRPSGGPAGGSNIYTRPDAFRATIDEAISESIRGGGATVHHAKSGPVDMGADCRAGADCAAGVCVTDSARRYCSRGCGPHDRCPAHFRCQLSRERERSERSKWVCVEM